jgi:hypothetical protein
MLFNNGLTSDRTSMARRSWSGSTEVMVMAGDHRDGAPFRKICYVEYLTHGMSARSYILALRLRMVEQARQPQPKG